MSAKAKVVDAVADIYLIPNDEDCKTAVPRDPANCGIAKCALRTGARSALIMRSVAYVELPDKNGKWAVRRFLVPPTSRRFIEALDRTEKVQAGGCVYLKAPAERMTLKYLRSKECAEMKRKSRAKNATKKTRRNYVKAVVANGWLRPSGARRFRFQKDQ